MTITRSSTGLPKLRAKFRGLPSLREAIKQYVTDLNTTIAVGGTTGLTPAEEDWIFEPLLDFDTVAGNVSHRVKFLHYWLGGISETIWPGKSFEQIDQELSTDGEAASQLEDFLDTNLQSAIANFSSRLAAATPPASFLVL